MTVALSITVDTKELRQLVELKGKAKFAGAKALTWTAKDAQTALKIESASVFHLRNSWVPRGIRIDAATPGTMNARVGSIDKYMERHVTGKDKPAERGLSVRAKRDSRGRLASGGLLIQPYGSIGNAPTHTVVRRKMRRIDTQKKKPFQIIGRGGSVLIVRRKTKKRYPLELLAVLKNRVDVDPIWRVEQTVSGVVSARFADHFMRAMAQQR